MNSVPLSVQTAGSAVKKATETLVSAAQHASVQMDDDSGKIKVSLDYACQLSHVYVNL